jgi:predicted RNase H-like nuclease (RuvC/YqgF family)|tara:strand:+ start:286 stop:513 length:228 start_codon:yes stop_codon:yes gene_type:complete
MARLRVEGNEDLVRDTNSGGAIINTNRNAYEIAKRRAAEAQKQRDEIRSANREINNLKCEMHEIKSMLKTLLEKD